MAVIITKNFGRLADLKLVDRRVMREVGLLARERILSRTAAGQGPDGPFAAYSPGYATAKAKTLGAGPVNLTVSGRMLNAIVVDADDTSATLTFSN